MDGQTDRASYRDARIEYFTLFNVISFSIRENDNLGIQPYDLHKEVIHHFLGISK